MPMATIEALIEALGASSATTVFETMKLVEAQSDMLRQSPLVANPMAVRHGSDFFKQYLVRELRQLPSSGSATSGPGSRDQQFEGIRQHLLRNARLFATRAKDAREKIAYTGRYVSLAIACWVFISVSRTDELTGCVLPLQIPNRG